MRHCPQDAGTPFYTATPSKVAKRKEKINLQEIGAANTARCRNRQIQQQGAVPTEYKIPLNKNKKNDSIH
jgi:hypothetical protein